MSGWFFASGLEGASRPSQPPTPPAELQPLTQALESKQFDAAVATARRLAESWETSMAADPAALASRLHAVCQLFVDAKRYADAIPFARRALELRESTSGVDGLETAEALDLLVTCHYGLGNDATARPLAEREVEVCRRHSPAGDALLSTALYNLGMTYYRLNDFRAAAETWQAGLATLQKATLLSR
jgi:tetratricopeptide (TPR) repeat protein